jgi:fructosamine-3-kinase
MRLPLEQFLSDALGRPWRVQTACDMVALASHPAAILSDKTAPVFVKYSGAPGGLDQFEVELAGLRYLAEHTGVLVPSPLGILPVGGGHVLVMETVTPEERAPAHWRAIGQTLARIHMVQSGRFGFERSGFFGPLPQDNSPADDWPAFYAERRLQPGLKMAIDSGHLPPAFIGPIERVTARLPELCGAPVRPTLLHGDAQKNNFISSRAGAYVIDPAMYYGHPEMDLAYIDYFEPTPAEVFLGYQEMLPIDPGFWERRELWRMWGYLAWVTVDGGERAIQKLREAVQKYA